jgi:N,N'-diacetyllegionaminate synthase
MTVFVAEMGQPPSLEDALAMVDDLLADAVKVQVLDPERIAHSSARKYWSHGDDRSQREVYADNGSLSFAELKQLRDHTAAHAMEFIATPFDPASVRICAEVPVDRIKIASGDITNLQLLDEAVGTEIPLVISTGAATWGDIDRVLRRYPPSTMDQAVFLACSLEYPTPLANASLARIADLGYGLRLRGVNAGIGYSDHTLGTKLARYLAGFTPSLEMIEKHVSFDRPADDGNPDNEIGLTPKQFTKYVKRFYGSQVVLSGAIGVHPGEDRARHGARRSLWWNMDLPAGATILYGAVDALRPGRVGGQLAAEDWDHITIPTARLARPVIAGHPVLWEDFA